MKVPGMFSKNSKISVLNKMIGKDNDSEPQLIVPQNSITTMRHKFGMCEVDTSTIPTTSAAGPQKATDSSAATTATAASGNQNRKFNRCPHCENMAKNLLYLENLIMSNYNSQYQCSLCYSVLKYLQFVNKRILSIFNNVDSIVGAAKLAPIQAMKMPSSMKVLSATRKHKSGVALKTPKGSPSCTSKHRLHKKKSTHKATVRSDKSNANASKRTAAGQASPSGLVASQSVSKRLPKTPGRVRSKHTGIKLSRAEHRKKASDQAAAASHSRTSKLLKGKKVKSAKKKAQRRPATL